jgi:hypothetical protein
MGCRPVSSNGYVPPPASPADEGSTVIGLARELEQLYREVRQLRQLSRRVDELAAALAQLAETMALTGQQPPRKPAPRWLDHPLEAGHDPATSRAAHDAKRLLAGLARWVETVYLRYSDAGGGLPDCWMRHPDVVEELLWLHRAWLNAYDGDASPIAVGDWHDRQRPGAVARIRAYAGTCSLDAHKLGHDQHAPVPVAVPTDEVEVIADWWATARDHPAPAPSEAQLAAALERHRKARR